MRHVALVLPFLLLAGVATAVFADDRAAPARAASEAVDFARDIEPIFRKHCYACHGADAADGGLRLDHREAAARGGFSGGQILGGDLAKNELWTRVATPEADFRMPKNREPLADRDLDLIKRWIQQGSPWTDARGLTVRDEDIADFAPGVRDIANDMLNRFAYVLLALCIGLLVASRLRKGAASVWKKALGWLKPAHVLVVAAGLMLVSAMGVIKVQTRQGDSVRAQLHRAQPGRAVFSYLFGDPPRPHHPPVAPTLDATYYRGNDERTPKLYNYGRYRTATMGLTLRDARGKKLSVGDPVPADGLFMHYRIDRSPNTATRMYATDRMAGVFLSQVWFDQRTVKRLTEPAVFLDTIKENWAWDAKVPLGALADGTHSAFYYVYVNYRDDGRPFSPQVHYGIQADVIIENGKIAEGSDLWLGNLFWNTAMEPPPVNFKMPADEWLHHEPLLEIEEGHNYHEERESAAPTTRPAVDK